VPGDAVAELLFHPWRPWWLCACGDLLHYRRDHVNACGVINTPFDGNKNNLIAYYPTGYII